MYLRRKRRRRPAGGAAGRAAAGCRSWHLLRPERSSVVRESRTTGPRCLRAREKRKAPSQSDNQMQQAPLANPPPPPHRPPTLSRRGQPHSVSWHRRINIYHQRGISGAIKVQMHSLRACIAAVKANFQAKSAKYWHAFKICYLWKQPGKF